MSLRLVRRPDGEPAAGEARPITAAGTRVGRAPECDLVLDDMLRLVSRQHGLLVPQDASSALLRCISTTAAIHVNNEPLPPGAERVVYDGDLLRFGGFEVLVEIEAQTLVVKRPVLAPPQAAAPVALPVAPVAAPVVPPVVPAAPPVARAHARPIERTPVQRPAARPVDPPAAPVVQALAPVAPLPPQMPPQMVPPALPPRAEPIVTMPRRPASMSSGVGNPPRPAASPPPARAGRLDQHFDLDTVPDPLGIGSPLPPPTEGRTVIRAEDVDPPTMVRPMMPLRPPPLAAPIAAPVVAPVAAPGVVPMPAPVAAPVQAAAPIIPPQAAKPSPAAAKLAFGASLARAAAAAREAEADADSSAPTRVIALQPGAPVATPTAAPQSAPAPSTPPAAQATASTEAPAGSFVRPPNPALQALRQAFLKGAGLDERADFQIDPAWMEHLGALLRVSTDGTLALLRSRSVAKRSIRAENTQIVARENNPLKFAPDGEHALQLLLSLQTRRGFLEPVEALLDAHADLQVHQLAMAAGMRAAVFELISRLGPEATEAAEGPAHGLAQSIPALRDAALWRRHKLGHERMLENLDDVFEAAFGREFVKAYEAQAKRGERDDPPAPIEPIQ